jgi:NAD(P)H-nitrite reductase large subunit
MKYVVLGASAAGISGVTELRKLDKDAKITLISKDDKIYSRCILHHYMEGIRTIEELSFVPKDFISTNNIEWIKGVEVTGLDVEHKNVKVSTGETVSFDKLLLATGAYSFTPPIPGINEANNVKHFRNINDCIDILNSIEKIEDIVVMGAGLVGIDAVSGLLHKNKNLSIVEIGKHILPMQLDELTASVYSKELENKGVSQYFKTSVQQVFVDEHNNINKILLSTGETINCQLLIVAAGVRPNISFLEGTNIELDKYGLVIDAFGRTSQEGIFGAGDISGRRPIWPNAVKEGIIAASNMSGLKMEMTDFFHSKSTMNFFGIPTMSLGMINPLDDSYIVEIEHNDNNYKKIIHKDGKICGAIIQGDLSYSGILTQLIKEKIDISKIKKPIFKVDYSDFFNIKDNFEFEFHN